MPHTVKDAENLTVKPEGAAHAASNSALPGDSAIKQQPVALEVPVAVNGARAVDGSDKREPFSESTKTVLIFGSGAVIRLSSSVAPGQLLFLTNEKTKKEVVCQVVKSKSYRNVSGYVELEFTEPVVGFWGMRFPGDRISSAPQQATSAPVANVTPSVIPAKPAVPVSAMKDAAPKHAGTKTAIPAALKPEDLLPQKPVAPVAPLSSALSSSFDPEAPLSVRATTPPPAPVVPVVPVSPAPQAPVNSAPAQPIAPVLTDSPRASEVQASFLEPAKAPAAPISAVTNLLALFEGNPSAPELDPPPAVQVCADPETETLKKHTARLQEQLSNMMFSEGPEAPETVSVQIPHASPVVIQKELAESAAKALEQSKIHTPEPAPMPPARVEPVKREPQPAKSLLDDEELKIPAWLEPLARNAATPSSTQEPIDREKAKHVSEQHKVEEIVSESVSPMEKLHLPELPLPTFGSALPLDEDRVTHESRPRSSGKGLLIGAIAASVVVLAGGGWWYVQQQSGRVQAGSEPASNVQASVASLPAVSSPSQPHENVLPQANPPAQSTPSGLTNASAQSKSSSNTLSVVPAVQSAPGPHNSQPISNPAKSGTSAATSASAQPPVEEPKKPILGEVRLAKPKVSPGRHTQTVGEPDAGINLTSEDQPDAESLNTGLAVSNNQPSAPAAPLPVGGDVKQAKLISSVPPVYPTLAKNQHVSGSVTVDALIDANGRVTTMKVVSGPTLLQQAATDALKQWKYQPASLDGKPVPMHLTVTIQFRLP